MGDLSTRSLLARHVLREPPEDAWVEWAVGRLVAGDDGRHLRILAGESPPYEGAELHELLARVIEEQQLGPLPDPIEAQFLRVDEICAAVVAREIEPALGAARAEARYESLDFDDRLVDFMLLGEALKERRVMGVAYSWNVPPGSSVEREIVLRCRRWLEDRGTIGPASEGDRGDA